MVLATPPLYIRLHHIRVFRRALSPQSTPHLRRPPFRNRKQAVRAESTTPNLRKTGAMSLVFDGEHAVGPSPLALLPQKILMWGPTVGVIPVRMLLASQNRALASVLATFLAPGFSGSCSRLGPGHASGTKLLMIVLSPRSWLHFRALYQSKQEEWQREEIR